jgi:hypothetical protein
VLDPRGVELVDAIAAASEGTLSAAVFFGSRSSGVTTTSASAYDLLLVCDEPGWFYASVHRAGLLKRSPRVLAVLDAVMAPTQVRLARDSWVVKASVVSTASLRQATSINRRDQFLAGRLFQDVHIVWALDPSAADQIQAAVDSARWITLDWVSPDLPDPFTASDYVRQLFQTSFRFEVRPETRGRAAALFAAQSDRLVPVFEGVLASLAADGRLAQDQHGRFSLPTPVGTGERLRRRVFLEWSRVRATARWPKHAITFDGWLDYMVKKAERHSGETIVLSPLERRFPFVFLWPRVFRFLARQRRKARPV